MTARTKRSPRYGVPSTPTARAIEDLSLMRITDDDQFLVAMQNDLKRLVRDSLW